MALARIRQLSAHEVGHTLGLDHNMAASTYGRASVMDYPAPYVKIVDGKLDLSEAYTNGVGAYDVAAIRYAYAAGRRTTRSSTRSRARRRCSSPIRIRVPSAARIPSDRCGTTAAIRWRCCATRSKCAASRSSSSACAICKRASRCRRSKKMLLPLYLHHRYQTRGRGEVDRRRVLHLRVNDDGSPEPPRVVPAARQREALDAVMATLEPEFLEIPQRIVELIPPPAYAHGDANTELFPRRTDPTFDPIAAAMTSADITRLRAARSRARRATRAAGREPHVARGARTR